MKGAEFDNFLMILRANIEYCSRETDCSKCSLLTLKTSYAQLNREARNLHLNIEIRYS